MRYNVGERKPFESNYKILHDVSIEGDQGISRAKPTFTMHFRLSERSHPCVTRVCKQELGGLALAGP